MNEIPAEALKELQKRLSTLLAPLNVVAKVTVRPPKGWRALRDALQRVASAKATMEQVDAVLDELRILEKDVAGSAEQAFRQVESEFIRSARQRGVPTRELDTGWRLGGLEFVMDRLQGRVQVLYNREVLVDWASVQSSSDFDYLVESAEKKLRAADIPAVKRDSMFVRAYARAAKELDKSRVSTMDLFRAFRKELVDEELASGHPAKRLKSVDFSLWSFLRNLDRHRAEAVRESRPALMLETGSQQDHAKGLAMVLQGASPEDDYKTYCWVTGIRGES